MLEEALDEDSVGNIKEAFELYKNVVDFYLKIVILKFKTSRTEILFKKQRKEKINREPEKKLFNKLQQNIPNALERAEQINELINPKDNSQQLLSLKSEAPSIKSSSFTKEEIDVLRNGSFINGRDYVPFFPEIDRKEKFFFPVPYR